MSRIMLLSIHGSNEAQVAWHKSVRPRFDDIVKRSTVKPRSINLIEDQARDFHLPICDPSALSNMLRP